MSEERIRSVRTDPPNALAHWEPIAARLDGRDVALFLDYDGTLAEIAATPDAARMAGGMRVAVARLSTLWPTTIVSGRARSDVEAMIGLENVGYAGSHGFDIAGPPAAPLRHRIGEDHALAIAAAAAELREVTRDLEGVLVEEKGLSVALHYRLADAGDESRVRQAFLRALQHRPRLRATLGKRVLELRPDVAWDKGRAVLWILERLRERGRECVPIYLGDDLTDEDAFRVVADAGVGVVVAASRRRTHARYSLASVGEVECFLGRLAALAEPPG